MEEITQELESLEAVSNHAYYISYFAVCVLLVLMYVKIRSQESNSLTTKEFKNFQYSFLTGYGIVLLVELISVASFFHIMVYLELSLDQITRIYMTTAVSTIFWGILIDIFDIGSRRNKCILSAGLFGLSLFSLYFGGHYDMIILSRIIYGAATALHNSSFEAYVSHQHTIMGYPDEWLSQTFSLFPHLMSVAAASSGLIGHVFSGPNATISLIVVFSSLATAHIFINWEKDTNPARFMWSNFTYIMSNTFSSLVNTSGDNTEILSAQVLRSSVVIGGCFEAVVMILSYYWAPWIASTITTTPSSWNDVRIVPYSVIYATYVGCSMLGNYCMHLYNTTRSSILDDAEPYYSMDNAYVLFVSLCVAAALLLCGTLAGSALTVFVLTALFHLCMGVYCASIGVQRAETIPSELRNAPLTLTRCISLIACVSILYASTKFTADVESSFVLLCCGVLVGFAAFLQYQSVKTMKVLEVAFQESGEIERSYK